MGEDLGVSESDGTDAPASCSFPDLTSPPHSEVLELSMQDVGLSGEGLDQSRAGHNLTISAA